MTVPTAASLPFPIARQTPCLVDRIALFIQRFVFLKEKSLYHLLALWVLHTYLIEEFDHTGYVFAHSPEPESGKTRLLEVLDVLVYQSSQILTSPTEAVLFRTAKGRTQLLDEVDTWNNCDYLKGILNAGSRRGGTVLRLMKPEKGDYEEKEFPVFGARALSGIGMRILPEATRTRTFSFAMVRKTREEKCERFRYRIVKLEAERLVKEINEWVVANRRAVAERYGRSFPYLDLFGDRTVDVSEPLAAILEVAYKDSPDLSRMRIELLHAISVTRAERSETIIDHRILEALCFASETEDPLIGSASELAERCSRYAVTCDEYAVSRTLRSYGFESKSIRKGDDPKKRYSLSHLELAEILNRYVCSNGEGSYHLSPAQPTTAEVVESKGA